jgi:hypothetical protein
MNIIDKIEQQWLSYVAETGRQPKYLYMGDKEARELDKIKGMFVITHKDMFVVMVEKDSWLSVGDRYENDCKV